jgi:tRNA U34 5-carboxymethylaminomethyl modifying GTPase MnmE/TrmE
MMAAVVSSIKAAEAILAVVDSSDSPEDALAMFQPGTNWTGPPMAVLLNKSDLLSAEQVGGVAAAGQLASDRLQICRCWAGALLSLMLRLADACHAGRRRKHSAKEATQIDAGG